MAVSTLRQGDYCPNGTGGFQTAAGLEEILERVRFKLMVRRGSFPFLPQLGSRLYLLPRAKSSARQALGAAYVAEALAGEDLEVRRVSWDDAARQLTVYLVWQGEPLETSVII